MSYRPGEAIWGKRANDAIPEAGPCLPLRETLFPEVPRGSPTVWPPLQGRGHVFFNSAFPGSSRFLARSECSEFAA